MKKILFLAVSAILLSAGCQKTEVLNPYVGDSMTFSAGMGKLTKADNLTDTPELQNQGFKTWVYAAYADQINGVTVGKIHDRMEGIDVTYKDNAWGTTEEYFWPANEDDLDFFAVSTRRPWAQPAAGESSAVEGVSVTIVPVADTGNGVAAEVTTSTMTVNDYSVDSNAAADDLMVAGFLRADSKTYAKTVPLQFKHALSKVIFKFDTNRTEEGKVADVVSLQGLSLDAMSIAGDLTVNGPYNNLTLTWAPDADKTAVFSGTYTSDNVLSSTEKKTFATWLVIPQTLGEKMATITYKINEKPFTYKFKLAIDNLTAWGPNQVITYNINLSPNKITFAPVVDPWENVDDLSANN